MPTRPPQYRLPRATFKPPQTRRSSTAAGYDRDWRAVRADHLRQHPLCVFCLAEGRTVSANIVDHIVPLNSGGPRLDPQNLRSVCSLHHNQLTGNYRRTGRNELV